uniref:VIT family protein n=2 Tax=Burkholderiaceae TaxID=119060 RepID=Q46S29_CUPPJ
MAVRPPDSSPGAASTVGRVEVLADRGESRGAVLDVVDRVSEMCFGLFMALTFVGAVSSASAGAGASRTMLHAALGCNLAWGLVDAVMYLVRTIAGRGQRLTLAMAIKHASDRPTGIRLIRDALPPGMKALVADAELDAIRARLAAAGLPARPRLYWADLRGAVHIFCIVVLSTFPVALPFVLMSDVPSALLVSRVLTLGMLFFGGAALGHYAGFGAMPAGLGMTALGVALTIAIIALGG